MGQITKMEVEEEMKSCGETFYEIFRSKQYLLPEICSDLIKEGKVIYGDWRAVGSIKEWTYVAGGNCETSKETVEAIDESKKSITFKVLKSSEAQSNEALSMRRSLMISQIPLYLSLFASMIQNADLTNNNVYPIN